MNKKFGLYIGLGLILGTIFGNFFGPIVGNTAHAMKLGALGAGTGMAMQNIAVGMKLAC